MFVAPSILLARGKRSMKLDDLFRFQRISDPQISPDGLLVAYVLTVVNLEKNETASTIWLAPTTSNPSWPPAAGTPRQLTATTKKDKHPRWSPDGKQILFESNRSGDNQLWVIAVDGGEARQVTSIASEAATAIWSPDGQWIAFVSAVYPEYSEKPYAESNALNKKRKEEADKNPVKARVFKRLFFRHWDEYVQDKRQHLFVMPAPDSAAPAAEPRDVTPGDRDAYPTSTTFSVGDDFTFSPDSKYLVFTAVPERDEAWSTRFDICRVPVAGGSWHCLTADNPAADGCPRFSPDGKWLAYRSQKRPGYEADRWVPMLVAVDSGGAFLGKPRALTEGWDWDYSVGELVWSPDGKYLITLVDRQGERPIAFLPVAKSGGPIVLGGGASSSLSVSKSGGLLAYANATMSRPNELFVANTNADSSRAIQGSQLTAVNAGLLAELDLPRPESVTVKGAGDTPMQMWLLKPPGFDPQKKWPLAYLVHGGPQGAWEDAWSYRWNPALWAAQGYVVALPNPRGSTGFGQDYVDQISGDWGGKCYEDLMAGVAYLEGLPYIDRQRLAAAGASFGGYMINWFQGHTSKFQTLISHCGVFNFDSMYATTEELWFDEWEHGGLPWESLDSYEKFSPHRFAKNFRTPMLIIHNDLDFRVPISEGIQLFTTVQRLGVPSKLINFPDEGHWVQKPANSAFWHKEVFDWLAKYVPPGGR
jgi:dipeptidyl aminopeptidase/acylaminoacyl peptidase